jgi:HAD superfamily hydrolase (TIGR01458 family)
MPLAYLFDLDGTLYTDAGPFPGAVSLLRGLKARRIGFCYVTNATSRPRTSLVERLRGYGFEAELDEAFTPVTACAAIARGMGCTTLAPFGNAATLADLREFELVGGTAEQTRRAGSTPCAVVIGDLGERWSFALMQEAFDYLVAGAHLIALSRDRFWMTRMGLTLDAGPFVAGLEYASGKTATVAGKPSPDFFHAAARSLGLAPGMDSREIAMVGDDIWSDIQGAQRAGYQCWLVRTGKFQEEKLKESGVAPERLLESVAEVGALLRPG